MEKLLMDGQARLINADSLVYIKTLPDASIDLIATDPPYFGVKALDWDNQWKSEQEFLAWLEQFVVEFRRVLKPNGSLYLFCSSRLSSAVELMIQRHMRVLSHIVWAKPSGPWNKARKEDLRSFFPATERVIFAEQYGADGSAKAGSGYAAACSDLRRQVFSPLIEYFRQAREASGVTAAEINAATGTKMSGHWFGYSQWQLPSQQQYEQLQALFASKAPSLGQDYAELTETYQGLSATYTRLVASYDQLKEEFERLRRPFFVTKHVPFTDVWMYPSVPARPGKHPCEKPAAMMRDIIRASSRPGAVVADFFMGSGQTGKQAVLCGRSFIGVELETPRYEQTCREFEELPGH